MDADLDGPGAVHDHPGLALFYSGLVRSKNVLSVMMQTFAITGLITVLWCSTATACLRHNRHGEGGDQPQLLRRRAREGVHGRRRRDSLTLAIPESVFATFQMTFAIITPALIVGAFAERMKFSAMLLFMGIWFTVVYAPSRTCLERRRRPDVGLGRPGLCGRHGGAHQRRHRGPGRGARARQAQGYPTTAMPPHNLGYTIIGASMLWVGWFGFNAGSAVAADGNAGMAMLVTQIATATAALTWMFAEWTTHGKPSVLGIASARSPVWSPSRPPPAPPARWAPSPSAQRLAWAPSSPRRRSACLRLRRLARRLRRARGRRHHRRDADGRLRRRLAGRQGPRGRHDDRQPGDGPGQGRAGHGGLHRGGELHHLKIVDLIVGLRVSEEEETEGLDTALHGERGYII